MRAGRPGLEDSLLEVIEDLERNARSRKVKADSVSLIREEREKR